MINLSLLLLLFYILKAQHIYINSYYIILMVKRKYLSDSDRNWSNYSITGQLIPLMWSAPHRN